jgi:saccharopine dehydrogenase-like NADP-dependent oxidoreductase
MKKVAIIGAGMMTKPIADYLMEVCNYQVIMADQEVVKAKNVINHRPLGKAVSLVVKDSHDLDPLVKEVDIVISMLPRPLHIHVAKSCLRQGKSMLTTSYEPPEVLDLADEAKKKGILFLNEMGEDPGLDHMGTQMLLDETRKEGGKAVDIKSYGCGIPAFEHNNNPMGYKFSWAPSGVFSAARTGAAYYVKGKRVEVPPEQLFKHFRWVDIDGIGTFETYPNRDCKKYLEPFALTKDVSYYRGLLRYPGYCNHMRYLGEIGLLDSHETKNFENVTYRQFTTSLLEACPKIAKDDEMNDAGEYKNRPSPYKGPPCEGRGEPCVHPAFSDRLLGIEPGKFNGTLEEKVAESLNLDINADFIHRLKWLGFFQDTPINIKKGTRLDVLAERMLEKMSYKPYEKDMIIVHIEITAQFPGKPKEKRIATMIKEGIPYGDSAMSRAVGLPAAISARMILENQITATGAHMPPTLPNLYPLILEELAKFGFAFKKSSQGGLFL